MELNAYQPCPCHAQQKIKFCCGKQIVDDLNQVMALARGNQTLATLDKLDRLIAERGPKDCLLTLKTHFLITMMEIDKARECNEQFLRTNPKHPIGMQHQAMICLAENNLLGAINALQDAMDGIKGNAVPVSLANAFRLVGLELLRQGHPIAARQHLSFARSLNKNDEQAALLIVESYRIPTRSQLLKQDLELPVPPDSQPWTKTYQQLRRLAARGQWRTSLQYLEVKFLPQYPAEPTLLKAAAILALWLARNEKAADAWAAFAATPGISVDQAIDAEIWIQVLRDVDSSRSFDIVQHTIPVENIEELLERMHSSDRFATIPTSAFDSEEGPPPKAAFVFLDRPVLRSSADIEPDRIPNALTEILLFGRQTDRPARLEFDVVLDGSEEELRKDLLNLLGELADASREVRETVGLIPEKQLRLAARWHLPPDIDRIRLAELERRHEETTMLETWPQVPSAALEGKAPADVVSDSQYRLKLEAMLGLLELADQLHGLDPSLIDRLREKLKLSKPQPLDPRANPSAVLTPLQRQRIQWELAPDEMLMANFYYAMTAGHWQVLRAIGQEILKRPSLEANVPLESVCNVLANITKDNEESLNFIRQARKIAHAKGKPQGIWLVAELELRIKRNITEKTEELFEEIRVRHMGEPNVESRMQRLVAALGFGDPNARVEEPAADLAPVAAGDERSSVWTPQSAEERADAGKLWLPGD